MRRDCEVGGSRSARDVDVAGRIEDGVVAEVPAISAQISGVAERRAGGIDLGNERVARPAAVEFALSNSFAFGGLNAVLAFRRFETLPSQ